MTLRAFISDKQEGFCYVAERSPKEQREFLWTIEPLDISRPSARIDATQVPAAIRRQAYKALQRKVLGSSSGKIDDGY
jgi:hypothetical protein